eukprot:CFRG2412T1
MFYKTVRRRKVTDKHDDIFSEDLERVVTTETPELRNKVFFAGVFFDKFEGKTPNPEKQLSYCGILLPEENITDSIRARMKKNGLVEITLQEQYVIRGDFFSTGFIGRKVALWKVFAQLKKWFSDRDVQYESKVHVEIYFPTQIVFIFPVNRTLPEWVHPDESKKNE